MPSSAVGFLEGSSLQWYTQVGVEDAPYLSMFMVYAEEGKKEVFFFHPPKLGDPPQTYEGAHSSFVPPTTAAVAVTTSTQLWRIDRRPVLLL